MTSPAVSTVNATLTPKRRKRPSPYKDTTECIGMIGRMIRAVGLRLSDGDPDELAAFLKLSQDYDAARFTAISGLRANGTTWAEIGALTGTSKQAAEQWYSRRSATTS